MMSGTLSYLITYLGSSSLSIMTRPISRSTTESLRRVSESMTKALRALICRATVVLSRMSWSTAKPGKMLA